MLLTEGLHDATVYGEALVTAGLTVRGAISGLGLVTRGLIWECQNIWTDSEENIATNWTAPSSPATSWTNAEDSITTTWTEPSGEPFAEC